MKQDAVNPAAAPAAIDKGGAHDAPPIHPTRVGNNNINIGVVRMLLLLCLSTLVGCAGGPSIAVHGPRGMGFAIGGGYHQAHGGAGQAPSLPVHVVMQIERECGRDADTIERRINRMGYAVVVTRRSDGGFHYAWGGGYGHPQAAQSGCVGPVRDEWWADAPGYRPGCGIVVPRGSQFWAKPPPWNYVYTDPEMEWRHKRNIHRLPWEM